jgi:hypothetical protein
MNLFLTKTGGIYKLVNADINNPNTINKISSYLRDKLLKELDTIEDNVVNSNFNNYDIVFQGKESRNKTIDRITAN